MRKNVPPVLPFIGQTPFQFERYGSSYHLKIEDVEALTQVLELDEAHWVATNAPIETINTDPVFLALVDTDHDGRIRTAEVTAVITWLLEHLQDTSGVRADNTTLQLSAIRQKAEVGPRIHRTALKIAQHYNSDDPTYVTLEQVRRIKKREAAGGIDTAGMVLPTAAKNEAIREFLEAIIAAVGGEPHPGGDQAVTRNRLEQFLHETRVYLDWLAQAELSGDQTSSEILPFGNDTGALYTLFARVRDKIDHHFVLCDAVQLAPNLVEHVQQEVLNAPAVNFGDPDAVADFLADAPLVWPPEDNVLNFEAPLNPYYAELIQQFCAQVLPAVLGHSPTTLSPDEWQQVKDRFAPYQAWIEAKPQVSVERVSADKLRRYRNDQETIAAVRKLIQESYKTAFILDNLSLVEQLILYQAHLIPFVNSFVSFPHLYDPNGRALFEMGTLIMDGRHFTLSVWVPDRARHVALSNASNMFVLYVELSDKDGEPLYEVAVPVTAGMRGNLQVNKRGIFRDIHGRDLHARVVEIVENPISFFEAISLPFQRLGRAITAKLNEISANAEESLETMSAQAMETMDTELKKIQQTQTAVPRQRQSTAGGLLAGGSIAIAALSSSFAFITKTLSGLSWYVILAGLLAGAIAVMLPTSIVAYLKLSKRDLSSILEGSGWGINARMRLTHKQAQTFTLTPPYPTNSTGLQLHHRWWRRKLW